MRCECRTAEELNKVLNDAITAGKNCNYRHTTEQDGFEGWIVYISL